MGISTSRMPSILQASNTKEVGTATYSKQKSWSHHVLRNLFAVLSKKLYGKVKVNVVMISMLFT